MAIKNKTIDKIEKSGSTKTTSPLPLDTKIGQNLVSKSESDHTNKLVSSNSNANISKDHILRRKQPR